MSAFRTYSGLLFVAVAAAGWGWTAIPAFCGDDAKPEASAGQAPPAWAAPAESDSGTGRTLTPDQLYDLGKDLFDQYAPPEIKEQYEFPSKKQWDEFAVKLQRALDGDSVEGLARYESQARVALAALRTLPGYEDYADWLQERLDMIEAARSAARKPPAPVRPPVTPAIPSEPQRQRVTMPYYDLWRQRLANRPVPANAGGLMPALRSEFTAEHVPPEFAWIAEVESSFNPEARSPSGAEGLYQLMPEAAKKLGLSTWFPDERMDPARSASAAARMLRALHARFGDWPLALAAYNAGAGRVERLLAAKKAKTFAEISGSLPVETRFYVPKVCATIALRTGLPLNQFAGE